MYGQFLLAFGVEQWAAWVILPVGLCSAGLALLVGKVVFRGQAKPPLPIPVTKDTKPEADPFDSGSPDEKRQAFRRGSRLTKVFISAAAVVEPFRDRFWPKSVISFLVLATVMTLLSVQFVTPTRRWRPSLPGPIRRLIRRRSA